MTRAEKHAKGLPILKTLVIGGATLDAARAELLRRESISISRGTATNWKAEDERQTGVSWDAARSKAASQAAQGDCTPAKILEGSARAVAWLLANQAALLAEDPKGYANALTSAQGRWLEMMEFFNRADLYMEFIERYILWARKKLSPEAFSILHGQLVLFRDDAAAGRLEVIS